MARLGVYTNAERILVLVPISKLFCKPTWKF